MRTILALTCAVLIAAPQAALAAIGCTLSNPAEDIKYLYPEMTSYREDLKEFPKLKDGPAVFKGLRERLGSDLDPIYETYETPYTVYEVFQGKKKIGVVHGVNVPGKGGVIQVFLAADPGTAQIKRLFFQRLESPAARALRDKSFRKAFEGLTLADFYKHDYYAASGTGAEGDKVAKLPAPKVDEAGRPDVSAALRGIRKNLILLDVFVYGRRFEPYFEKARAAAAGLKGGERKP
jgi:hypothetical protein